VSLPRPACAGQHCQPEHHGLPGHTRAHPTGQPADQAAGQPAGHAHGPSADSDARYLGGALTLIVGFMAAEVVVALVSGSLALLADAGHMLTDAGALGGALWAVRLTSPPARGRWTFGFKRAEIISAGLNGVTLLVVGVLVAVEGVRRLLHPPGVQGAAVLTVALVGVGVNVAASWLLARADRHSLNVEGAFRHVLTDLWAFLGTAAAGVVILVSGWTRADAVASLAVVALLLHSAWSLLRDSGKVLLEGAPEGVDLDVVRGHLLDVPEVRAVHDLHLWTVTSSMPAVSAHVVVDDDCFRNGRAPQVLDRLQTCLGGHFDVEHSTFQLEPSGHSGHEHAGHD